MDRLKLGADIDTLLPLEGKENKNFSFKVPTLPSQHHAPPSFIIKLKGSRAVQALNKELERRY